MTLDAAILKLIEEREITGQAALLDLLKHAGHALTQPTLSRHIKKLGIQKITGRYQRVEPAAAEMQSFTLTPVPPNLVVIRTRPGYAQPLAVMLDQKQIAGAVGTLAGDDTVFIAVTPAAHLKAVAAAVERLLSGRNDE
ncbi:MAG: arginine repressor [Gammaproteobacteria bacterium]|nr:arginine repressor [Gammaproteobacteria bacterium]